VKYQEKFIGSKKECSDALSETISKLMRGHLEVEGINVEMPKDKDLEYKIKYDSTEEAGAVSIKITWNNIEESEEEDEDEEE
jgi:hypothetical protein